MRLHIISVGRWSAGPERSLFEIYAERIEKSGRAIGIGPLSLNQIVVKKQARTDDEAKALIDATPENAFVVALDEAGKSFSSTQLAGIVGRERDEGTRDMVFLIGGADGHGERIQNHCQLRIGLGPMTWPHFLARGLIAEQLYRTVTILSGHPYHRA